MVDWDADLEGFLSRSVDLMTDREIARAITYITGEVVSEGAVKIKRKRLGLLRGPSPGRAWDTKWNHDNTM